MAVESQHTGPLGSGDKVEDELEQRFGNRFLQSDAPDKRLPQSGMPALDAMRLLGRSWCSTGSRSATSRRS